ncbi:MAG TPA: phospholipase [Geobacter sp.]|nr:phospholipase [Geobacter sp.]
MTILKPGLNCMGIYETRETGLIVDACDYYRAFYQTALRAKNYLLMAGWQFDSEVSLLRGEEAKEAGGEVRFLNFLEELCQKNPELEIYILAWDFSAVFSLEREWFQNIIFNWSTSERLHFRFDSVHAAGATHHQKFIVADGAIAYVGGMDICSSRWDDRRHLKENPDRVDLDGTRYGCYHDIQSYHTGPVVKVLIDLFVQRWMDSGGEALQIPTANGGPFPLPPEAFAIPAERVAVSRTQMPHLQSERQEIKEIRHLFVDAITSAESLIYLESQYFSSRAIYWSLIARMSLPDRPRLQIIMMLPDRLPLTEELFLGLPQLKMIRSLQLAAEKTGHTLSVYSSAQLDQGNRKMTFIHSKLLIIDDRFLTIGSANATNRSMGLDTELNVSWEADNPEQQGELVAAIRRVRASLLAEHAGLYGSGEEQSFENVENLTRNLDCLADDHEARLCRYQADPNLEKSDWPDALEPIAQVVDPEKPVDNEFFFERLSKSELGSFAKGIFKLSQLIIGL